MNSETLIIEAGSAIYDFALDHAERCYLYIKDGHVVCCGRQDLPHEVPNGLSLPRIQQISGLTTAQWNIVGSELFNLYTKEIACHPHQKHST